MQCHRMIPRERAERCTSPQSTEIGQITVLGVIQQRIPKRFLFLVLPSAAFRESLRFHAGQDRPGHEVSETIRCSNEGKEIDVPNPRSQPDQRRDATRHDKEVHHRNHVGDQVIVQLVFQRKEFLAIGVVSVLDALLHGLVSHDGAIANDLELHLGDAPVGDADAEPQVIGGIQQDPRQVHPGRESDHAEDQADSAAPDVKGSCRPAKGRRREQRVVDARQVHGIYPHEVNPEKGFDVVLVKQEHRGVDEEKPDAQGGGEGPRWI
mmetsp:Transcript_28404/g.76943  ORF Transcript_28404/g.76943 Transcript_28404/m.76943 type:complete len:265 (-) Transcript_28404:123-917(-)